MQFALSTNVSDAAAVAALLQPLDPQAQVALDASRGVLEVISTASANQIVHRLEEGGIEVQPLEKLVHISGGSTCCGGCS